jgi:hypothetical protein
LGVKPDDAPSASPAEEPDDGEVSLEDDADEALETTVDDRWRNFPEWLGVSRGLRLVHFHDVDDVNTGRVHTRDRGCPAVGGSRAWSALILPGTLLGHRLIAENRHLR